MKTKTITTFLTLIFCVIGFVALAQNPSGGYGPGQGGQPGGTNGQLQYNNNGVFAGIPGVTQASNGGISLSGATACIRMENSGTTGLCDSFGNAVMFGPWGPGSFRLKLTDQGQCTMAAGTCSAQSLGATYAVAPIILVTWTGTGTCTGILKAASTTTTATPSSSVGTDTCQVNWAALGN